MPRRAASGFARVVLVLAAAVALTPGPALARGGRGVTIRTELEDILVTRNQRRAIDRGLAWIAAKQQPGGTWGEQKGTRVADTALSVLALMAGGSTVAPGTPLESGGIGPETLRGPYARHVRLGLEYLARQAWAPAEGKVRGYIQDDDNSKMHGHGFATLALAEACGNLGPSDVRRIREDIARGTDPARLRLADQVRWALELAITCTERAQDRETGGWSYYPTESDHEGSMTVTQIEALRSAMNSGVRVNGAVMRSAYEYIRASQNRTNPRLTGGFAYRKSMHERVSYGLTAAALTTLFGLGRYGEDRGDRDAIRLGMEFMDRELPSVLDDGAQWFYYNLFYGAQALYLSGDEVRMRRQWPLIRDAVMAGQRTDGSFRKAGPSADVGEEEYSTAIAVLTLQVPMETLPIFQRR